VNCPNKFHEIHTFGFGRAALSGAYKVIRMARQFCFPDCRYRLSCEILTLGDGVGWRDMPPPQAPVPLSFCRDSPVTINGVVYLLPLSAFHSDDSVFCFDLDSEEWKNVIRGPLKKTRCYKAVRILRLAKLSEKLLMVHAHGIKTSSACMDIWIMTDYDNHIWDKA
jgi:F-box interacting protein